VDSPSFVDAHGDGFPAWTGGQLAAPLLPHLGLDLLLLLQNHLRLRGHGQVPPLLARPILRIKFGF
jgi:hypothetical protein